MRYTNEPTEPAYIFLRVLARLRLRLACKVNVEDTCFVRTRRCAGRSRNHRAKSEPGGGGQYIAHRVASPLLCTRISDSRCRGRRFSAIFFLLHTRPGRCLGTIRLPCMPSASCRVCAARLYRRILVRRWPRGKASDEASACRAGYFRCSSPLPNRSVCPA